MKTGHDRLTTWREIQQLEAEGGWLFRGQCQMIDPCPSIWRRLDAEVRKYVNRTNGDYNETIGKLQGSYAAFNEANRQDLKDPCICRELAAVTAYKRSIEDFLTTELQIFTVIFRDDVSQSLRNFVHWPLEHQTYEPFAGLQQHYGFITDYLDVTQSADVAAYFATHAYSSPANGRTLAESYERRENSEIGYIYAIPLERVKELYCDLQNPKEALFLRFQAQKAGVLRLEPFQRLDWKVFKIPVGQIPCDLSSEILFPIELSECLFKNLVAFTTPRSTFAVFLYEWHNRPELSALYPGLRKKIAGLMEKWRKAALGPGPLSLLDGSRDKEHERISRKQKKWDREYSEFYFWLEGVPGHGLSPEEVRNEGESFIPLWKPGGPKPKIKTRAPLTLDYWREKAKMRWRDLERYQKLMPIEVQLLGLSNLAVRAFMSDRRLMDIDLSPREAALFLLAIEDSWAGKEVSLYLGERAGTFLCTALEVAREPSYYVFAHACLAAASSPTLSCKDARELCLVILQTWNADLFRPFIASCSVLYQHERHAPDPLILKRLPYMLELEKPELPNMKIVQDLESFLLKLYDQS
jgi:FRG domain